MKLIASLLCLTSTVFGAEPFSLTMELDWKPNVQFAGILLAKDKGWYQEAGLEVTIPKFDSERDIVKRVAESDHTIGSSESGVLLRERAKGYKIKAIGTMFQGSPLSFISLQKSNIKTVADLNGKTIGLHSDTPKVLEVISSFHKIKDFQFKTKIVGYHMDELKSGTVDVAQGYIIDEAVMLQTEGLDLNIIKVADNGYSAYSQAFFVSEDFIAKHPREIQKFLEVSFRGWREAFANQEATAKLIIQKFYPEGTLDYQTQSLKKIEELMTRESPQIGQMKRETWQASTDMFHKYGIGETPKSVDDLLDFQFLKAIYPLDRRVEAAGSSSMLFPKDRQIDRGWLAFAHGYFSLDNQCIDVPRVAENKGVKRIFRTITPEVFSGENRQVAAFTDFE